MLKSWDLERHFAGMGAWKNRMVHWARPVALAIGMFILCQIRPMMGIAPLALAFFAGALAVGESGVGPLVGGFLGSMSGWGAPIDLNVPIGSAIVLGGGLAWECLKKRLRLGTSPPEMVKMLAYSVLAGLGTLLPGMVRANGDGLRSVQAAACAMAAVAATPFVISAFSVRSPSGHWLRDERIGLAILLWGMVAGLSFICEPLGMFVGALSVGLLYPSGSLMGIILGSAVMMVRGDARMMCIMCAGGIFGQMMDVRGKFSRSGAAVLGMFVGALILQMPTEIMAGAILGGGICGLLPEKWLRVVAEWAIASRAGVDLDDLANQLCRQSSNRLWALSRAFGELAECYLMPGESADEQYLIGSMRNRLCVGCSGYGKCWDGTTGVRFLCGLVSEAVEWAGDEKGGELFEGDVPPDWLRQCRRGRMIPERLSGMLEDFALHRQSEKRRSSDNRLISAQFLQAQQLLKNLAREQMRPVKLRTRQSEKAMAVLEKSGISIQEMLALSRPREQMIAVLKAGRWTREMGAVAARRLTECFGHAYLFQEDGPRVMRFVRSPGYFLDTGAGCISRVAGTPSGDSHRVCRLEDNKMLMLICDGMGSGEAAARESGAAVKLLSRFLSAGIESSLAIETVNAMLLGRSSEDMFATVDLMTVDTSTGMAEFIKLAACASLIVREGEVFQIEGGRLPLGILERVQPGVTRVQLQDGDLILMASDGVMDGTDMDALCHCLCNASGDMSDLAQRVLALADNRTSPLPRDDMTAICIRIRKQDGLKWAAG